MDLFFFLLIPSNNSFFTSISYILKDASGKRSLTALIRSYIIYTQATGFELIPRAM